MVDCYNFKEHSITKCVIIAALICRNNTYIPSYYKLTYVYIACCILLEGRLKELQEHREMEAKIKKSRTDNDKVYAPSKTPQLIEEL